MPLVSGRGPQWARPILATSEHRLAGLNPILTLIANVFGSGKRRKRHGAAGPDRESDEGAAGAGDRSPLGADAPRR